MRFLLVSLLATASFAQQYSAFAAKATGIRQAATPAAIPATWYDTSNRAAVAQAYREDFLPTRLVTFQWNGDLSTGVRGDPTPAYRNAVLQRINWFRAMAGVPAWVNFDALANADAQDLAFAYARTLQSVTPSASTMFTFVAPDNTELFTCLGFRDDPGCIAQYMADQGGSNAAVQHRRWFLYPQTKLMGTGAVIPNDRFWTGQSVMDANVNAARPAVRDEFVAWPPKGFVPYEVVYPRWSFSYPGADFSQATVTLTRNGTGVPITLMPSRANTGENSIVWVPDGEDVTNRPAPAKPAGDLVYNVSVNNVLIGGSPRNFTYQVTVFDPQAGVVISPDPPAVFVSSAPSSLTIPFTVDPPGSAVTAVSNASWLTVTGVQLNSFTFSYAANPGGARTGSISVGGAQFVVNQAAAPGCAFALSSSGITASPDDTTGQISLTAGTQSCTWTASSDRSWLQVFPLQGTGNAPVYYTVFPNFSSSPRTGTITVADKTFTVTQQAGTGTVDERFMRLLYFNYFGRLPSQAEIAFQLGSGQSRQQFAFNFLNSAEFNDAGRFVAGLYVGLLNRDAEYGGWLFQRNALARGQTNRDQLISSFINGAEFILTNGNLTNEAYVTLLYRQILGRNPSQAEVTFQAGQLNSGGSNRIVMARTFLLGNEFRQGKNARLLAFLFHATLLNRGPLSAEYIQRRDQIAANPSDATVMAILTDFVNSSEFIAQFN